MVKSPKTDVTTKPNLVTTSKVFKLGAPLSPEKVAAFNDFQIVTPLAGHEVHTLLTDFSDTTKPSFLILNGLAQAEYSQRKHSRFSSQNLITQMLAAIYLSSVRTMRQRVTSLLIRNPLSMGAIFYSSSAKPLHRAVIGFTFSIPKLMPCN